MHESEQRSGLPLLLIVGLIALVMLVVVFGGLIFANPFGGIHTHSSSSGYGVRIECSAKNQDCTLTIVNPAEASGTMTVSATSSMPTGATFQPATVTIAPGNQGQIAAKAPTGECLTMITLRIAIPMKAASEMPLRLPPCDGIPATLSPTPKP